MKTAARQLRHRRIRAVVAGTAERPRLVVFRGSKTITAQLVDDQAQRTLAQVRSSGVTVAAASSLGKELAEKAHSQKIDRAVFDRGGYAYHGVVRAVAEAAREQGLAL